MVKVSEFLAGMSNVVRFPEERRARPTIELLREIRFDVDRLLLNAQSFGFELPPVRLRDETDRETARHIEAETPPGMAPSEAFLRGLLEPVVVRAVEAVRAAISARAEASAAETRAAAATDAGEEDEDFWLERAICAIRLATELGLIALGRAEEAEGVARATSLAAAGAIGVFPEPGFRVAARGAHGAVEERLDDPGRPADRGTAIAVAPPSFILEVEDGAGRDYPDAKRIVATHATLGAILADHDALPVCSKMQGSSGCSNVGFGITVRGSTVQLIASFSPDGRCRIPILTMEPASRWAIS